MKPIKIEPAVLASFIILIIFFVLIYCHHVNPNTIRFTHIYDSLAGPHGKLNVDWIHARVKEFRQTHSQLMVELEQVKWDQIDTKAMTDFRAGIPHDVLLTSSQLLAKHGIVGDLLDLNQFFSWSNEKIADFSWNPVWNSCEIDRKRLGIPMGAHARLCVYRKDMFSEMGLDAEKPPQTLDDLLEIARKLTRDTDGDGKIDIWGLGIYFGPSRATIEITFAPILWQFGGDLWDSSTKQAVFASEAGIKATQFLKDLVCTYKVTPRWAISGTYDDVVLRGFLDGKFAIAWGWGSYWIQVLEQMGWVKNCFPPNPQTKMEKVGVFLTPTKQQAQFTNTWAISIFALSQRPVDSFQFLLKFVEPMALSTFPDAGLPSRLSIWQKPEYQSAFYQSWFQAVEKGRSMPPTAHYEELANTVAAAIQEIMINETDIKSTLQKFQNAYNIRYAGE